MIKSIDLSLFLSDVALIATTGPNASALSSAFVPTHLRGSWQARKRKLANPAVLAPRSDTSMISAQEIVQDQPEAVDGTPSPSLRALLWQKKFWIMN